jgi:Regulator of ribonuclease activity B
MDSEFTVVGRFDPSDPGDPDGDAATLSALAASGSDLSRPTTFIHYLSFLAEENATAAGRALAEELGYRVQGFAPEANIPDWGVQAEVEREPTLENVRRMRQVMAVAAERFHGDYDGWEAAIQR